MPTTEWNGYKFRVSYNGRSFSAHELRRPERCWNRVGFRRWVDSRNVALDDDRVDLFEDAIPRAQSEYDSQRRFRRVRGKHGKVPTNMHMPTVSKAAREPRGNGGRVE